MTLSERATTRISQEFAGFIHSLSENENAAMRALMLMGANQVGIEPMLVADDLRSTIAARLPPAIYERLLAMLARVDHDGAVTSTDADIRTVPRRAPSDARILIETTEQLEATESQQTPDPFGSLGFDFEETDE